MVFCRVAATARACSSRSPYVREDPSCSPSTSQQNASLLDCVAARVCNTSTMEVAAVRGLLGNTTPSVSQRPCCAGGQRRFLKEGCIVDRPDHGNNRNWQLLLPSGK